MVIVLKVFRSYATPLQIATLYGSVGFLYNILFHWKKGSTPGKAILRIQVVDNQTERPVTFKQSAARECIPIFAYLISISQVFLGFEPGYFSNAVGMTYQYWGLVEIFTALSNSKRRSLHDYIAKTVCIKIKPG